MRVKLHDACGAVSALLAPGHLSRTVSFPCCYFPAPCKHGAPLVVTGCVILDSVAVFTTTLCYSLDFKLRVNSTSGLETCFRHHISVLCLWSLAFTSPGEDTGVQQGLPFKSRLRALTGVAQKVGRHPAKRNVSGWIPGHQSPVGAHVTGN